MPYLQQHLKFLSHSGSNLFRTCSFSSGKIRTFRQLTSHIVISAANNRIAKFWDFLRHSQGAVFMWDVMKKYFFQPKCIYCKKGITINIFFKISFTCLIVVGVRSVMNKISYFLRKSMNNL